MHWDGAKPQVYVVQKICTKGGQTLLFLSGTRKLIIRCNLTNNAVGFCKTLYTCSPSSLGQDPTVEEKESKENKIHLGFLS